MNLLDKIVYFNLLFLMLFFSGCANKEAEIIVQEDTKIEYITPPESFTKRVALPEPINVDLYLQLNQKERERSLTIYTIQLINLLNIENEKKDKLKQYILENKK